MGQLPVIPPFPQVALVMEGGQGASDHPRSIPAAGQREGAAQGLGMAREGGKPSRGDVGQD